MDRERTGMDRSTVEAERDADESAVPPVLLPRGPSFSATRFIGRREELRSLRRLVREARLVTLTGAGGIGKSRLALEVAHLSGPSFPDGVWFVDAGPSTDADGIRRSIATALGLRDDNRRSAGDRLESWIGPRTGLLLLDDCEAAVEPIARVVSDLVGTCPNLHVLATTRRALGIPGEAVYVVPTLPISASLPSVAELGAQDAVRLFIDRVTLQRPGFRLTAENARAVHALCHGLGGLPLAIELAAARARHFDVAEMVDRLERQHAFPEGEGRSTPHRQRSLRGAIEWSLGALPTEIRRAFPRLGILRGSFDRDAAAAVTELDGPSVDAALTSLVDESLLVSEAPLGGRTRFRLLEPIRQDALARLRASGDEAEVAERHARSFAAASRRAAQALDTSDEIASLARLEADLEDLQPALEWMFEHDAPAAAGMIADLADPWQRRGHGSLLASWQRRGEGSLEMADLPALRLPDAVVREWSGDFVGAGRAATLALEEARRAGDQITECRAAMVLGRSTAPDEGRSRAAFAEAQAAARASGRPGLLSRALGECAFNEWALGDRREAVRLATEALAIARRIGNPGLIVIPASVLARDAMFPQRDDAAERIWHEALRGAREAEDPSFVHFCLTFLALLAAWRGEVTSSVRALAEAADLLDRAGGAPGDLAFAEMVGLIAMRLGRPFEGLRLVLAKERLAGPDWIDSPPWWEYVRQQVDEASASVGARASEARLDTSSWSREDVMVETERVVTGLRRAATTASPRRPVSLSPRESELARLVADGLTNRQIGGRLSISERTAEAHVRHILDKLGFANRAQIAAWAARSSSAGEAERVAAQEA